MCYVSIFPLYHLKLLLKIDFTTEGNQIPNTLNNEENVASHSF